MKKIVIYTTEFCPYCHRAKALLDQKQVPYENIDVTFNPDLRSKMRDLAGGFNSVPQIFIDDFHVGGSDELNALEEEGKLDALLGLE